MRLQAQALLKFAEEHWRVVHAWAKATGGVLGRRCNVCVERVEGLWDDIRDVLCWAGSLVEVSAQSRVVFVARLFDLFTETEFAIGLVAHAHIACTPLLTVSLGWKAVPYLHSLL